MGSLYKTFQQSRHTGINNKMCKGILHRTRDMNPKIMIDTKIDNKTTIYKQFQIEVEDWPQQLYPVCSSVISADIGEEDTSLWSVKVEEDDDKVLEVSLYRMDSIAVGVDVTIDIEISHHGEQYKVTDHVETGEDDLERDDPCFVTATVLDTKQQPNSHLTFCISGLLEISYLTPRIKCQVPDRKCLTFGPVQELHYVQKHPKITFPEKILQYSHSIFKDFITNVEKEN